MPNLLAPLASADIALLRRLLAGMLPGQRSFLARQIMADRFSMSTTILADFFSQAFLAWKNKQYDIHINGEEALLQRLAPFSPRIVIDVGANIGEWSLAACRQLPAAQIHAFEISAKVAAILAANVAGFGERIIVNAAGLGEKAGEIEIYSSPESSTATSTILAAIRTSAAEHGIRTIQSQTGTILVGDAYLHERNIQSVALLKIDVEGAEPAVLNGFAHAFEKRQIDIVQFEYGAINVATRHFLQDYYSFFQRYGFRVGKLFPEGVLFKPYEVVDEDFVGPNFVACRAELRDMIEAVRCPAKNL